MLQAGLTVFVILLHSFNWLQGSTSNQDDVQKRLVKLLEENEVLNKERLKEQAATKIALDKLAEEVGQMKRTLTLGESLLYKFKRVKLNLL